MLSIHCQATGAPFNPHRGRLRASRGYRATPASPTDTASSLSPGQELFHQLTVLQTLPSAATLWGVSFFALLFSVSILHTFLSNVDMRRAHQHTTPLLPRGGARLAHEGGRCRGLRGAFHHSALLSRHLPHSVRRDHKRLVN